MLGVAATMLALFVAPASALQTHRLIGTFNGSDAVAGVLGGPNGIGIDESTGDLYVADTARQLVFKFDAEGNSVDFSAIGRSTLDGSSTPAHGFAFPDSNKEPIRDGMTIAAVAVDNDPGSASYRDFYVLDSGNHVIDKFAPSGAYLGQLIGTSHGPFETENGHFGTLLGGPYGVAVDRQGDVWVYESSGKVDEFDQAGAFLKQLPDNCSGPAGPGLAVDSEQDLYLMCDFTTVTKFTSTGLELGTRGEIGFGSLPAVDPVIGHLFMLSTGFKIEEFDPLGSAVSAFFFHTPQSYSGGLAVDGATGDFYGSTGDEYASEDPPRVFHWGPLVTLPDVETEAATETTPVTARLNGTVNPAGSSASYQFEYGTTSEYGKKQPASPVAVGSDKSDHHETIEITGLTPDTTYHFRIDGINECEPGEQCSNPGEDQTFQTTGPPLVEQQEATSLRQTCAILKAIVAPEGFETTARFQYGTSQPFANETAPVSLGASLTGQPLSAEVCGLQAGVTYQYRVIATNSEGAGHGVAESFTTVPSARFGAVESTELTATTATLKAAINPLGNATKYRFEWGPCTTSSTCPQSPFTDAIPVPDQAIGSGASPVEVLQAIDGLSPNVTYHFRVVATNTIGTATSADHTFVYLTESQIKGGCPNQAMREANGSAALPACRAYELVTPSKKNGSYIGALFSGNIPPAIAADGNSLIAPAIQCFAGAQSCVGTRITQGEPFRFARTETGWSPQALALPASRFRLISSWRFNAETGSALFIASGSSAGQEDWYVHSVDESIVDLGPLWEPGFPGSLRALEPAPTAATADFSRLAYVSTGPLWPSFDSTASHAHSLYEYPGPTGFGPGLVGVSGGQGSNDLISTCGTSLPYGQSSDIRHLYNALSADGRSLFFNVAPCAHGSGANATTAVPVNELFVRIDGEGPEARTVAISEPSALSPAPANPACTSSECIDNTTDPLKFRGGQFQGASSDGSRVYFTSTQQLTDEASQDPRAEDDGSRCALALSQNGCNLYLYASPRQQPLAGVHLIDVSAGDISGLGPKVQGVIALSSDGTHVYFVAKGVLTSEPNSQGQAASEGAENLYLYERDANHPQGRLTFATTLSPADAENWSGNESGLGLANVTPDGRFLLFTSHRGLTPDAAPGEGSAQVYRYDAATAQLSRVSIGTRGFNDNGNAVEGSGCGESCDATIVPASSTTVQRSGSPRPDPSMSDDGSRIFFKSPVALTPGALNLVPAGKDGRVAQNIYEWEADGTGAAGRVDCDEPSGCIFLLSTGRDIAEGSKLVQANVELFGTDPSGQDVFFATAERLTWQDTDTQRDYYDARIGGGFAEPALPVPCEGDVCKGPGTQAGSEKSPATPNFSGPEEGPRHPIKTHNKARHGKKHRHKRGPKHNQANHRGGHK